MILSLCEEDRLSAPERRNKKCQTLAVRVTDATEQKLLQYHRCDGETELGGMTVLGGGGDAREEDREKVKVSGED